MKLKYAIFDLDGTVLDSLPVWDHLGLDMLRAQGYDPDPALGKQLKILTMTDGAQLCKDLFHMPQSIEEIAALVEDQASLAYNTVIGLKPGVENFLRRLKDAGIPMYVATNTRRELVEDGLRRNGVLSFFEGIITCPEVGQGKKEGPAVYEEALRLLGGTKENTVVFEDAIHPIRTAKAAGFRLAAIYDSSSEGDHEEIRALADYYFHSYDELSPEQG
jgi:HAD superfamily hydrolase (TIGR01509 family)